MAEKYAFGIPGKDVLPFGRYLTEEEDVSKKLNKPTAFREKGLQNKSESKTPGAREKAPVSSEAPWAKPKGGNPKEPFPNERMFFDPFDFDSELEELDFDHETI